MLTTGSSASWVVAPEERTVHLWLEHPTSILEWDEIEAALVRCLDSAERVEFAGPGWSTSRALRMARLLKVELQGRGLAVEARSPALDLAITD